MTDEFQQVPSPQENPPAPQFEPPAPVQPQKSNKKIWIIVGIVLGVLCLCSIACFAIFGVSIFNSFKEKAPVEAVLDDYMQAMANKDTESAYALFSPRAQRQVPISDLEEMLEGNNFILYEGYQSLSIRNINIGVTANADPDARQGIVANVSGMLTFEGDIQGSFSATLEKVDDTWMLDGINVTVPPEKMK